MGLHFHLTELRETEVYWSNITHNLAPMAQEAGIYVYLWRPEENGVTRAEQLIVPLTEGLRVLKADPDHFCTLDAKNGWGTYEHFVPFVEAILSACKANPEAKISVSV